MPNSLLMGFQNDERQLYISFSADVSNPEAVVFVESPDF